jgi:ribosomal protein S4E
LDITTGKIMDFIKFEPGNLCMVTGGRNTGRVGTIINRERHPGSFDIVHVKVTQQQPSLFPELNTLSSKINFISGIIEFSEMPRFF